MLSGSAPQAIAGIAGDFALLDAAAQATRVWTCDEAAVVLGISRDADSEVDRHECVRRGVALLRRASGGGTVAIGPGTLQYALVLPHSGTEAIAIDVVKRLSNDVVRGALARCGIDVALDSDVSGDLRLEDRKVGGVALRRHRDATMIHGTLLLEADLAFVAAVLRHPASEPEWRRGRSHGDFLANLGAVDSGAFALALGHCLETARYGAENRR